MIFLPVNKWFQKQSQIIHFSFFNLEYFRLLLHFTLDLVPHCLISSLIFYFLKQIYPTDTPIFYQSFFPVRTQNGFFSIVLYSWCLLVNWITNVHFFPLYKTRTAFCRATCSWIPKTLKRWNYGRILRLSLEVGILNWKKKVIHSNVSKHH